MSNKRRISASVDKDLIAWLDRGVKDRKFANRSHGIEYCIQVAMKSEKKE